MTRSLVVLSVLLSCFFASGLAVTCTEQHVGHMYSPCTNNKRIAIFYWTQNCVVGDYQLHSPIYDLPCVDECKAGNYLPFGGTDCLPCSKGDYSLGGGEVLSDWTSLPDRMTTDCTGNGCRSWNTNGTFLESGNNGANINMESTLRLFAKFLRSTGNSISFSYTVDAESCSNCDGLIFYIDDQPMTSLMGHQLRWATLTFNVTEGYHDFRWSYKKDYSISKGLDRAFIRSIELIGTTSAPETCADCPAGYVAPNTGSTECTPCDYNTYSPLTGQETCIPCFANQTSFPGSAECSNLIACQAKHIYSKRTPCNPSTLTQNIEYHFITLGNGNVKVCDPLHSSSVSLPATEYNVRCVCPPGQRLDSAGACVFCPDGTARNNTNTDCVDCPAGTAALESLYLSDWSSLPANVQTFCQGECDAQGWIPRGEHIDTGYGSGRKLQSFLSISNIEIKVRGAVSGMYTLASCGLACDLEIIFDNDQAEEVDIIALNTGTNRTFSFLLDPGNYTLTWRYIQRDTISSDSTKVKLYTIVVSGVSEGGAPACVPCTAGYEAKEAKSKICTLCQPGFYSSEAGVNCVPADPGFIVKGVGATRQIPCGAFTTPNKDRTDCVTDCTFSPTIGDKTVRYDLRPLYNPESMNFAGTDLYNHQYFLNLCSREHKNASCYNENGEPIPTFACQQVESWRYAVDLGSIIGFNPNTEGNQTYFTVSMTEGTPGCARLYGTASPRATNVTMICDLSAGLGTPRPSYGNAAEYPTSSCRYFFTWRSMYACPLCTAEDYKITISDCHDGKKVQTHVRLTECWDPAPIPTEEIPCKICPEANGVTCNDHGSCDDISGACNCENSWAGDACELCSFGFFGETCEKECPGGATLPCLGHGICSAGLTGNGSCICSTGWAGDLCDSCAPGFQGDSCQAIPASVTDVVPWWGFVLIFGGLALIVTAVIVLWRQKRNVEYKYSSLLRAQPLEMDDGDDNVVGIPQDDSDPEGK